MKHLPFTFAMLAIACTMAAIWRTDYAWQLGATATVFVLAAAGIAGARQARK